MLHKKKPVPDSRILKEVAGAEEQKLELGVMVIGGSAVVKGGDEEVIPPVAGADEGMGEDFWRDLRGFLVQRLKSEELGERAVGVFKTAWKTQK